MWKIIDDGKRAVNKVDHEFMYAGAFIIRDANYERDILEEFDTADEAKAKLLEIVTEENNSKKWKLDEDGNAFYGTDIIFHETMNGFGYPIHAVFKRTWSTGIRVDEFLSIAADENKAKDFIREYVDKLNREEQQ